MIKQILIAALLIAFSNSTTVMADAIKDSLEAEMQGCVRQNISINGSPVSDEQQWAKIVALSTTFSYSQIKLFGLRGASNIQEALIDQTSKTIITQLEKRGVTSHRAITLDTVSYCMPFAVAAAIQMQERLENASCPDDSDYQDDIAIIKADDLTLQSTYGTNFESVRSMAVMSVEITVTLSFQEVFFYGSEKYPKLSGGQFHALDKALNAINRDPLSTNVQLAELELDKVYKSTGNNATRLKRLKREFLCLRDWLEVYPLEEMEALK